MKSIRALHVLVVEDNLVNQSVVCLNLENFGFTHDVAINGVEALKLVEEKHYDLVLMDCDMPIMDGYEATKAIRQSNQARIAEVPIIALTANALKGDKEKCLEAGMDDYLTKPLDTDVLSRALSRWSQFSKLKGEKKVEKNLSASVIDIEAIQKIRKLQKSGREDFLTGLIDLFFETSQDAMTNLRSTIIDKNMKTMARTAHGLKSSAATLGAIRMADICQQLEKSGDAGVFDPMVAQLMTQLEDEFTKVLHELSTLRNAS